MYTNLKDKNVIIGVTASIAAYKSALLVREFIKSGANVKVIMTKAAREFITPLTLSTLSKNPVHTKFSTGDEGVWNSHVDLGIWADFMVMAPVTANTLGKMANGLADNLLIATYLSARCPVYFAPAMDLDMYHHPSTTANITKLKEYGNIFIEAGFGELASGLIGEGRMAEPSEIIKFISNDISKDLPLSNKKVLITAGPTHEAIDPVRFIGNNSSGKMGYALAKECANLGADVIVISGPTAETVSHKNIKVISIKSANDMYNSVHENIKNTDIGIFAAAVADYKPKFVVDKKIKKKTETLDIELVPTQDILASVGKIKTNQFLVGFALETDNELENAQGKLKRKNLDMIVLNSLKDSGAGFAHNTNKITIIERSGNISEFNLKSKQEVATDIIASVISKM
ncbi:MAG: bifunctional phosphopantothenoylcysteine decarboxylase/phosphopantothenate--cysteine ligase CoaBC [Ichthyobacteriaceae bacterium]|nr:bifunctional phosphopantothenoylcysteine decarboxylase/phosphopantothenate--cysteine ligase CoaBC [Ichthyobacteriaceae bacterium]